MKIGALIKRKKPYTMVMDTKTKAFAEKCYETNKDAYKKRNQDSPDTIKKQIKVGKIGELLDVRWAKRLMGFDILQGVDFKIYPPHEKNWSSDLIFGGEKAKIYFGIDKEKIKASCKTAYFKMGNDWTEYPDGEPIPVMLPYQYSWVYQLQNEDGVAGHDNGDHDIYLFNIVDERAMTVEVFAWVRADMVKKMFVKPFKPWLKDIKLVVQQMTCGKLRKFPCGIEELLDKNYEPKESI